MKFGPGLALLFAAVAWAAPAAAAPSPLTQSSLAAPAESAPPTVNSPEEVNELLARLTDLQVRVLLAETLRREASARVAATHDRSVDVIRETVVNYDVVIAENLMRMAVAIVAMPSVIVSVLVVDPSAVVWLWTLAGLCIAVAAIRTMRQRDRGVPPVVAPLLMLAGMTWGLAGALSAAVPQADIDVARTMACLAMAVSAALACVLVRRHHAAIRQAVAGAGWRGPDETATGGAEPPRWRARLARRTPSLLVGLVIILAFVWSMNLMTGDIAAVWSIQWAIVGLLALAGLDRLLPPFLAAIAVGEPTADADAGSVAAPAGVAGGTARRDVAAAARRAFRAVALAGLALGVPAIAGYDVIPFLTTGLGQRLWTTGSAWLMSYLAWQAIRATTDRYMIRRITSLPVDEDEIGGGAGRAGTLVPLLRAGAAAVLVLLVTITTLAQSGIDVTPLLASAGIIGLAIGFGAQTLVRDIVSGIFF